MPSNGKILVLRFSAMGDVAMIAPILKEFRAHYPEKHLVVVSRNLFKPFFEGISNITFHPIDPKGKHKGLKGLYALFKELKHYNITAVADLHDNLRSKVIRNLFLLSGVKVRHIDKGRQEKKQLTNFPNKILKPLKTTLQRYVDVFNHLAYPFALQNSLQREVSEITNELKPYFNTEKTQKYVGVSPFAQHAQKVYPLDKMEIVLLKLALEGNKVYIFGGGTHEQEIAERWEQKHPNIVSLVGKMKLDNELKFISHLDLMISMDSSGMHLASLKGVPVISIWGATHPNAGFLGYGQSLSDIIQIDLECRPCSIYGNKSCFRGDMACMHFISEDLIVNKVNQKLNNG